MKMIIMLGGMLHPISLRSDKLVSRGCIQLFFFALFCSHTFMYYTIFFFVKSNIWYSFGTYCEKGALLFSLCKCILLKLNTHCIQVGEAPKKGNGKYTKRHCETKTHQNGYHVDIRIVANRITFKRNGLNVQTNGNKNAILPSVYADLNLSFIINYTPSSARRSFFCCAKITNVTPFNCNLRSRKRNNLRKLAIAFCQPFFFSFADSQTARLGFYGLLAVG